MASGDLTQTLAWVSSGESLLDDVGLPLLDDSSATFIDTAATAPEGVVGYAGDLDATLATVSVSSAGTVAMSGMSDIYIDAFTAVGTIQDTTGAGAPTTPDISGGGFASVLVAGVTSQTLVDIATSASTGAVDVTGDSATTVDDITVTASTDDNTGLSFNTLDALSVTSDGTVTLSGDADVTLSDVSSSAAAAIPGYGDLDATLGAVTLSSLGEAAHFGTVAYTLSDVTIVAAGGQTTSLGTVSYTLDSVTVAFAGEVPGYGELDSLLGDVSVVGIIGGLDPPMGCLSEAEYEFALMLTQTQHFREYVEAADSDEALARIFFGETDEPTDGDVFGKSEYESLVPYAVIWTKDHSRNAVASGGGRWYTCRGILGLRLVRFDNTDRTSQENHRWFMNCFGLIMESVTEQVETAGALDIVSISLDDFARIRIDERAELGKHNSDREYQYTDRISAEFSVVWSNGDE